MLVEILFIALSLLLLFAGAEGLVRGSASFALRLGLTPLMIGLTVVAFGTSSPELVVSLETALTGRGDLAVGNVVGSNSFNIGVILGLTALLCPVKVQRQIVKLDAPIMLGVALLVPLLLLDGAIGRFEGVLLLAGIVGYTLLNVRLARRAGSDPAAPDVAVGAPTRSWAIDLALVAGGLALLVVGSHVLVDNASSLARDLGVSEAIIGLTIVAAGTSMPELATSVVAALRRQPDIAIGNIVGSNIFNVLAILGTASVVRPLAAPGIATSDVAVMVGLSALLLPLLWLGLDLRRVEGGLLLLCYGIYLGHLWPT